MLHLAGKRVVVMGLGRFGGGIGVTRFLVEQGAQVLVADMASAEDLGPSLRQLDDLPVTLRLGGHEEADFARADVVVVNPAIPPRGNPFLQAARAGGAVLTSEIRLLVQRLPDRRRVIGVTGSAGKSTVTAMIGHILRQQLGEQRVHVGGNLGGSLLPQLDRIEPDHWVVLELSSFMLEGLGEEGWSPHIAVLTNVMPNHLDWHGSFDAYLRAKAQVFRHQQADDWAILREAEREVLDSVCHGWLAQPCSGCEEETRRDKPLRGAVVHAVFLGEAAEASLTIDLLIPGRHNRLNAALALEACQAAGIEPQVAQDALTTFAGLPHRLQLIAEREDVRYYNDSKSTTPEAAMRAIEGFPTGTVHAILGGADKGSDLTPLAQFAARHCRVIYTVGQTGDAIARAAIEAGGRGAEPQRVPRLACPAVPLAKGEDTAGQAFPGGRGTLSGGFQGAEVVRCETVDQAMRATATRIKRGDAVLLSPGCASWDQFENYEARARAFVEAVLLYTGEGAPPPGQPDKK